MTAMSANCLTATWATVKGGSDAPAAASVSSGMDAAAMHGNATRAKHRRQAIRTLFMGNLSKGLSPTSSYSKVSGVIVGLLTRRCGRSLLSVLLGRGRSRRRSPGEHLGGRGG